MAYASIFPMTSAVNHRLRTFCLLRRVDDCDVTNLVLLNDRAGSRKHKAKARR